MLSGGQTKCNADTVSKLQQTYFDISVNKNSTKIKLEKKEIVNSYLSADIRA